ncbi:type VII secretion-associated serine protease mycosin [Kitasatospora griseola]|uniref:type VII secretion-associated serine protease mycosin n=1 Tax=Kitasatospora griseola TaxID=2064 RepID=UPI001E4C57FD|nr:type VII secretion-associated serine protease mycosin [Kitasatospora griseola]
MSSGSLRRAGAVLLVLGVVGTAAGGPAYAEPSPSASGGSTYRPPVTIAASGDCANKDVEAVPWALQRVVLNELWGIDKNGLATHSGKDVTVAVIDTGVDTANPQLTGKVIDGPDLLGESMASGGTQRPAGTSTTDPVGHGTKVAGIIAAAQRDKVGFVGLAKDAKILSIRQNDAEGHGSVNTLIKAIDKAIEAGAGVINISQDVRVEIDPNKPLDSPFQEEPDLKRVLDKAESKGIVVVASSGNDGAEGPTYPAKYETVLAVGASDRNNERATFSQYGDFVDVVAPGVDMLSTVPGAGQCTDNGTSFSAPYVSGLAAVLKSEHQGWTAQQIRTVIEQTAQRTEHGRNKWIGWGVVDPVKAVSFSGTPEASPHPDPPTKLDSNQLIAQPAGLEETQADRDRRTGTYVLGAGVLLVACLAGGAIVARDLGRRRRS